MKLYSIETGNFMLDGGALFGVVPKSLWEKRYPTAHQNLCNLSMRALLLVTETKKILIDCGMGNTMDENLLQYYFCNGNYSLLDSLHAYGYKKEDITDVIFTHLHFDHCGGAITKKHDDTYELTFPNATYVISSQQWESALHPNRRERPSFLKQNIETIANSKKIHFIQENTEYIPGLELRLFYGHTHGQIIPHIRYKNTLLIYCGDLIPTAAHIPVPYVCGYDILPLTSMSETETFLQYAYEQNATLFFEHDISVECCSLQKTPKGIFMQDAFSLQDFCKMNL